MDNYIGSNSFFESYEDYDEYMDEIYGPRDQMNYGIDDTDFTEESE